MRVTLKFIMFFLVAASLTVIGTTCFANGQTNTDTVNSLNNTMNNAVFSSNRYTRQETDLSAVTNNLTISNNYEKVAANSDLTLYADPADLSIRVVENSNGYIWGSSFPTTGERLNQIWQAIVNSAVTIDYYNSKNNVVQESITTDPDTKINFQSVSNGFSAIIDFGQSGIEMELDVALNDNGLNVSVPYANIKDNSVNRIASVMVYPFFGAVKENSIPGYIFLPDGSGALMRYSGATTMNNNLTVYSKPVYGLDLGVYNNLLATDGLLNPTQNIYMPVFGMVHGINQNAFVTSIDSGASYATINAYPAGKTTQYNWVYADFTYRTVFQQPTSQTMNQNISIVQQHKNDFNIDLSYQFLTGNNANYVGMANAYRNHLIAEGNLTAASVQESQIPLNLTILGEEREKGLIFNKTINMTTVSQMESIVSSVQSEGINNLTLVLEGWSQGGLTGTAPNFFPFASGMGSTGAFDSMIKKYNSENIPLYFYTDFTKAYQGAGGYNKYTELARKISGQSIDFNSYYDYNYLRPAATSSIFTGYLSKFEENQMNDIAIGTLGDTLFSDYSNETVSREDAISIYQDMLSKFNGKVGLYSPNDYLLKYTDQYFNVPMYSSQYRLLTDTVPFVSIVLSGYIPAYSPYLNFIATQDDLLRLVDYDTYPSFIVTNQSAYDLINSPSNDIYTSEYSVWKDTIDQDYNFVNDALKNVYGASIAGRDVVSDGVVVVTYTNNVSIIVNYTNSVYTYDGHNVEPENYYVING